MRRVAIFYCMLFAVVESAGACIVAWESPEELEREAAVVVDGIVIATAEPKVTFRGRNYEYRIRVEHVERGDGRAGELRVTYEDMLMHRRGEQTVCPLKHGSGVEHQLTPNGRYRFYLRSIADPEILIVGCGQGTERCSRQ